MQSLTRSTLTVPLDDGFYRVPNDRAQAYHIVESTKKLERIVNSIPANARRIVDLGGNVGLFSMMAARKCPDAVIECYEADPVVAEFARFNLVPYPNVKVIPKAVMCQAGSITFYRSSLSNQIGSTNREAVELFGKPAVEVEVPAVNVHEALAGDIDFLKVDIQGVEWSVFKDFDFSNVGVATFELSYMDPGVIELGTKLLAEFGSYKVLSAVHAGSDVVFER
ncbi:MAG: FkbM family methyltransferase [Sphingorhabdus sp.]